MHSLVTFSVIFWVSAQSVELIIKMQNKAVKMTYHVSCRTSCRLLSQKFNILPAPSIYINKSVMFVKKKKKKKNERFFLMLRCS